MNIINFIFFFFIYLWIGGFDCSIEFFIRKSTQIPIYELNYDSYSEWLESIIKQNPNYEETFLSRQEYIDGKYPNLNEIVDKKVLYYIQGELSGYEDDISDEELLEYVHEKIKEIRKN